MEFLEKEWRLAIIKVKKRAWVGRREQFQRRKWAEECVEKVLKEAMMTGRDTVMEICVELSGEMVEKSRIIGERRLEDKDRRLENASLQKAELLERLEVKKERLKRAEQSRKKFHANLNIKMLLESVVDMVVEERSEKIQTICISIAEEVVEMSLYIIDRRLEEKNKRLELARLKTVTARISILKVGPEASPFRGKKRAQDESETDQYPVNAKKMRNAATTLSTKKVWKKKKNGLYGWVSERKSDKMNKELDSLIDNNFIFGGKSNLKEQGVQLGRQKRIISAVQDKPGERLPDGVGSF